MATKPEIALLISTYQRPRHLQRALLSIAMQRDVAGKMEVVVTDDGSTDETAQVVEGLPARSIFQCGSLRIRIARFNYRAVAMKGRGEHGAVSVVSGRRLFAAAGPCGDSFGASSPGSDARTGTFVRLDEATSQRIDEEAIRSGEFMRWAPADEIRKTAQQRPAEHGLRMVAASTKPRLVGNNIGVWRSDYERINGFDENFEGWGWEDDDLGRRLRRAGVRLKSILAWTFTFHMWHPTEATMPQTGATNKNEQYLNRQGVLVRCRNGLIKRRVNDLRWRVIGAPSAVLPAWLRSQHALTDADGSEPEIEVVVCARPGKIQRTG